MVSQHVSTSLACGLHVRKYEPLQWLQYPGVKSCVDYRVPRRSTYLIFEPDPSHFPLDVDHASRHLQWLKHT